MKTHIISLGGSILAPDGVDIEFLYDFHNLIVDFIDFAEYKFVLVVGGGAPARVYQQAYKDIILRLEDEYGSEEQSFAQDRIGIAATHLNAQLVKEVFAEYAGDEIITNPEDQEIEFDRPILIGAGWKPGFSTDLDAVVLARRFGADSVINLSNIPYIYTADPRLDANAKALDHITWQALLDMIGDEWKPGMHAPFDPVACTMAQELDLTVISAEGRNLDNVRNILEDKQFEGTVISN